MRSRVLALLLVLAACDSDRSPAGRPGDPALLDPSPDLAAAKPAAPSAAHAGGRWTFTEIAASAGIDWRHVPVEPDGSTSAYDHGNGVIAGDIDGDGHADVVLLNQCSRTGYFLGRGDGTFADHSDRLALLDDGVRVAATFGDFDQDGRADLYVTFVNRPAALLRQREDGTFVDLAKRAGVDAVGHLSGATFADVDGDGDLDLVVAGNVQFTDPDRLVPGDDRCFATHEGTPLEALFDSAGSDPSRLFINGGALKGYNFTEEGAARGIPQGGPDTGEARGFGDVTAFDLDRDGDVDLFFPEMFHGRAALLENDGTGHFTDVTSSRMPQPSFGAPNAAADDFDGDGWPDLLVVDMHSDMWMPSDLPFSEIDPGVRYRGHHGPHMGVGDNPTGPLFGNSLWLSTGGGAFREAALEWGAETFNPWGALTADLDNDGRVDVFVPSGMSNPYVYYPDVLLHNAGDHFEELQEELGLAPPPGGEVDPTILMRGEPLVHSTRGAAVADFDEDGDLDILCYKWSSRALLFRNDLVVDRHWIDVDLRGVVPRDPYGARIEVEAGGHTQVRWMQASRGYLSQSARPIHVGLGEAAAVDAITVYWPDGSTSRIDDPPIDAVLVVRQGE